MNFWFCNATICWINVIGLCGLSDPLIEKGSHFLIYWFERNLDMESLKKLKKLDIYKLQNDNFSLLGLKMRFANFDSSKGLVLVSVILQVHCFP